MALPLRTALLLGAIASIAAATAAPAAAHPNVAGDAQNARLSLTRSDVGEGKSILIYGPSLAERKRVNEERIARRLGFDVTVATAEAWSEMNRYDFSSYQALVFGDPFCKSGPRRLKAAVANQHVWSDVVRGNVTVSGFDPVWHAANGIEPGPRELIENAIRFVGRGEGTGLTVSLSCYYSFERPGTPVELLDGLGTFTVNGQGRRPMPGCPDRIHIVEPDSRLVRGLTDDELSRWGCSVHQALDSYPSAYSAVAIEMKSGLAVIIAREG